MGADLSGLDIMVVPDRRIPHHVSHLVWWRRSGSQRGVQAPARTVEGGNRAQAVVQALIGRPDRAGPRSQRCRVCLSSNGSKALANAIPPPGRYSFRAPTRRSSAARSTKPEHHGASISGSACFGPACVAPSLGTRRCGEAEKLIRNLPAPGARRPCVSKSILEDG